MSSLVENIRDFWGDGGHIVMASGKKKQLLYYAGRGYPEDKIHLFNPEKYAQEPKVCSSEEAARHKVVVLNQHMSEVKRSLSIGGNVTAWLGVDVLTGISEKNPFCRKNDPEWNYYFKADRKLDPNNPADVETLRRELKDRYDHEFWALWEMTWALGMEGKNNGFMASLSLWVIGHFPNGIPPKVVDRSIDSNSGLAFKIGPGIDLASQYGAHGEEKAKCINCSGSEKYMNVSVGPSRLVDWVVFRYLTQHQMADGLMSQFEKQ